MEKNGAPKCKTPSQLFPGDPIVAVQMGHAEAVARSLKVELFPALSTHASALPGAEYPGVESRKQREGGGDAQDSDRRGCRWDGKRPERAAAESVRLESGIARRLPA